MSYLMPVLLMSHELTVFFRRCLHYRHQGLPPSTFASSPAPAPYTNAPAIGGVIIG